MSKRILIVDDDPAQRRILEETIKRFGFETKSCGSGEQAVQILEGLERAQIGLVLLDLIMPGLDGMAVLDRVGHVAGMPPIIVQTANGSIETAINAMRRGAVDFVVKPASPERLEVSIKSALKIEALTDEITRLKKTADGTLTFGDLVLRGEAMTRVITLGKRAAASNIPVLIEGESGVGKELIARAIQGESDRAGQPFITVNCGAIPENLIESILFGHEKGAFTGAIDKRIGKFQEADGGTLFLDEVGELPLEAQVKLLRALQEGEIDPVGSKRPVKVNFRLISATNRDMAAAVASGALREDLYYRLNVFPLRIPSLSERREDIPLLARHFISVIARSEDLPEKQLDEAALDYLCRYDWPGNIRQLQNAVFRAVVMSEDDRLGIADFPQIRQAPPRDDALAANGTGIAPADLPADMMAGMAGAPAQAVSLLDPAGRIRPLAEIEADAIRGAIAHCNGRLSEVARRLGIGRSTLYRRIEELGLENEARLARHGTMPALDRP